MTPPEPLGHAGQTINFFELQKESRRWSWVFALAFSLALATCLAAFLLVSKAIFSSLPVAKLQMRGGDERLAWQVAAACTGALAALTLGASLSKMRTISDGGSAYVASVIGAVPLGDATALDTPKGRRQEQTLRNVVAEMSLTSGQPEPDIYVMPFEESINAMAAGLETDDAALIVTKGALRRLTRDELSGLVAHEFSHMLNGDMRRFTVMAAWLHGLFFLQIVARLFRGRLMLLFRGRLLLLGLTAMVLGWLTAQAGRLLQAAFSRRRELLADASAVQFTRDAAGLAGTLKKIGGQGSHVQAVALPDFRHFFLAEPEGGALWRTRPPLAERIWLLEPGWDGWRHDFEDQPADFLAEETQAPPANPIKTLASLGRRQRG
jgi:Zn-dependent protease with chaperone function